WIVLRPQWRSWLTRGAFVLMGFGMFLGLDLLFSVLLPNADAFEISFYLTVVFAFGSAVYSAFLFWQAKGRDFWQSPLFAIHLFVMALLAGSGTLIMIDDSLPAISGVLLLSILLHA